MNEGAPMRRTFVFLRSQPLEGRAEIVICDDDECRAIPLDLPRIKCLAADLVECLCRWREP